MNFLYEGLPVFHVPQCYKLFPWGINSRKKYRSGVVNYCGQFRNTPWFEVGLVTTAWRVQRLRMQETSSDTESSCCKLFINDPWKLTSGIYTQQTMVLIFVLSPYRLLAPKCQKVHLSHFGKRWGWKRTFSSNNGKILSQHSPDTPQIELKSSRLHC